jgi:hypothetical protein
VVAPSAMFEDSDGIYNFSRPNVASLWDRSENYELPEIKLTTLWVHLMVWETNVELWVVELYGGWL